MKHKSIYISCIVVLPIRGLPLSTSAVIWDFLSPPSPLSAFHTTSAILICRSPKGVMDAKVSIFLGIPFATPPTGSLRYMPPVASTPWKGVKDAHRFAPVCPQQFPKQMHNR